MKRETIKKKNAPNPQPFHPFNSWPLRPLPSALLWTSKMSLTQTTITTTTSEYSLNWEAKIALTKHDFCLCSNNNNLNDLESINMNMGAKKRKKRWIQPEHCFEYGEVSAQCISSFVKVKIQWKTRMIHFEWFLPVFQLKLQENGRPNAGFHGVVEWIETFFFRNLLDPDHNSNNSSSLSTLVWNEVEKLQHLFVTDVTWWLVWYLLFWKSWKSI